MNTPQVRLKVAATLVGGITAGMLSLFLVGEMAGGELSSAQHLLQLLPLVVLLAAGWRWPHEAGLLLVAVGATLFVVYLVDTSGSAVRPFERALVTALFLVPPVLAGILFFVVARRMHYSR